MISKRLCALALAAASLALAPPQAGHAQAPRPASLSAEQARTIERIEAYLNGIRTLKARFVQVSSTGHYAEGDVYLARPGRLRFEYDPPDQMVLVADGNFLGYYDLELGQVSYLPLGSTPAGLLVRENLDLGDDVTVTGFTRERGVIRVELVQPEASGETGRVTLAFTETPLALRQWTIVDAQGIETTVTLMEPQTGVTLAPKLFHLLPVEDIRVPTRG